MVSTTQRERSGTTVRDGVLTPVGNCLNFAIKFELWIMLSFADVFIRLSRSCATVVVSRLLLLHSAGLMA